MFIFSYLNDSFQHLKLEIASVIPALNEWEIEIDNSAEEVLNAEV